MFLVLRNVYALFFEHISCHMKSYSLVCSMSLLENCCIKINENCLSQQSCVSKIYWQISLSDKDCIHLVCLLPYLFLLLFETGCFAATYTAHCGKQRFLPGTFLEKLCFVVSFQCCYAVNWMLRCLFFRAFNHVTRI